MNSVCVSGNVMLALREAIKLKSNGITFGFYNKCVAIAVEDIIGTLALFNDAESTHSNFVVRLPKEVMAEVIVGGYMQVESVDDRILAISIYKERECLNLIKYSKVAKSCSMDYNYLYEQIDPKMLTEIPFDAKIFSNAILPIVEYAGDSVCMTDGYMSLSGKGIQFSMTVPEGTEMTLPSSVYKTITKSINPNTLFYRNNRNTYLAQTGVTYLVWRGEYQKHKLDLKVVLGAEPLAEYKIKFPEMLSCGATNVSLLKDTSVEMNLVDKKFTLLSDICFTSTSIDVTKVAGVPDVRTIKFPAKLLKFIASSGSTIKVYPRFIRVNFSEGILDIGGSISV